MTSVPKPPAGLLERIQADIPQNLGVVRRPRRSFTWELSIAASVIVLIGAAWIAMHSLSRKTEFAAMAPPRARNAETRAVPATPPSPSTVSPAKPTMQIAEAKPQEIPTTVTKPLLREKKELPAPVPGGVEGGVSGGVVGGVVGGVIGGVPAPAAAPPPPPPPPREAAAAAKTANGYISMPSAVADEVTLTPSTLFGVATTRDRVDTKDTSSVVEHFAAPESRPFRELRVEADGAPQPLDATHDVIRVSIDAPAGENAPVASDAKLEIDFDPKAVVSHRSIVGEPSAAERVIVTNASATLLFDVELAPDLSRRQKIATVRLTWHSVANGKEQKTERVIRRRDITSSWDAAPVRTKRASLAAAWSEAVRNGTPADEIARRARDAGFDDLAELAEKP